MPFGLKSTAGGSLSAATSEELLLTIAGRLPVPGGEQGVAPGAHLPNYLGRGGGTECKTRILLQKQPFRFPNFASSSIVVLGFGV